MIHNGLNALHLLTQLRSHHCCNLAVPWADGTTAQLPGSAGWVPSSFAEASEDRELGSRRLGARMRTSRLILLAVMLACAGCRSPQMVAHPDIQEPVIRQVVGRLSQLRPGMSKQQVWQVLGKLPLVDKVLWISAGSDWGEGCDSYLLKHGYSLRLLWYLTDYDHYDWVAGGYGFKEEGPCRRAWLDHEKRKRIEF
jgi:hypothetical protein